MCLSVEFASILQTASRRVYNLDYSFAAPDKNSKTAGKKCGEQTINVRYDWKEYESVKYFKSLIWIKATLKHLKVAMNQPGAAEGLQYVPPCCRGNAVFSANRRAAGGGRGCYKAQIRILLISSIPITVESPAMHLSGSRYCSCFLNGFSDSDVCAPLLETWDYNSHRPLAF